MGPVWNDERVRSGMSRQLAERRRHMAEGAQPIGWKVAFGAPQSMTTLGIDGPVVGFLTNRSLLNPGATCSLSGWTKPALEPEIAVEMAHDLASGADQAEVTAAIGRLRPAIELADVDRPLDDLEAIMATNIFHRRVAVGDGRPFAGSVSLAPLRVEVRRDGAIVAKTDQPTALIGDLVEVVGHVADYLGAFGERLRAGDLVITGSTVPLIWPQPDEVYGFSLRPVGELSIQLVS